MGEKAVVKMPKINRRWWWDSNLGAFVCSRMDELALRTRKARDEEKRWKEIQDVQFVSGPRLL